MYPKSRINVHVSLVASPSKGHPGRPRPTLTLVGEIGTMPDGRTPKLGLPSAQFDIDASRIGLFGAAAEAARKLCGSHLNFYPSSAVIETQLSGPEGQRLQPGIPPEVLELHFAFVAKVRAGMPEQRDKSFANPAFVDINKALERFPAHQKKMLTALNQVGEWPKKFEENIEPDFRALRPKLARLNVDPDFVYELTHPRLTRAAA